MVYPRILCCVFCKGRYKIVAIYSKKIMRFLVHAKLEIDQEIAFCCTYICFVSNVLPVMERLRVYFCIWSSHISNRLAHLFSLQTLMKRRSICIGNEGI